jgi:co-chaperonin GroES (HSP10)|tara:strand:- start:703 stop:1122 length:420 start_codon:yes stop_codon:yes gene_type:complete
MAMRSIDSLAPTRSLIDLTQKDKGDFGLDDFDLDFIFDDILLVEYVDESENGDEIVRNGIVVPTNALTKAWRKGRVALAGPDTKHAKVGDIVIFPNNMGVTISNITIKGGKKVGKAIFLNEERMFGICKPKDDSTKSNS